MSNSTQDRRSPFWESPARALADERNSRVKYSSTNVLLFHVIRSNRLGDLTQNIANRRGVRIATMSNAMPAHAAMAVALAGVAVHVAAAAMRTTIHDQQPPGGARGDDRRGAVLGQWQAAVAHDHALYHLIRSKREAF
jgi:hypothetical protein